MSRSIDFGKPMCYNIRFIHCISQ